MLTLLLFFGLQATVWSQLKGISLFTGGEIATHRLVSPMDAAGLNFNFGFGQLTESDGEESFFGGIRADWKVKDQFGVQTQIDYGRVIYSVFFEDPTEENGILGPLNRGIFYAPDRLDFSVLPSYTLELNDFWITPKIGFTYSIPVREENYIDKIPDSKTQQQAVAIENALNRSFGGSVWKVNAGIDIGYKRFSAFANIRHQISSASDNPVEVEAVNLTVPFDNRLTALQFGLGYRVF
ncbi:hypothetical protein CLV84_0630 [Neolewinella xylanilytica]|uniref:Outer membrane protein with beta-barrel domain n=1 Tax=Neolewinella xylanilytica TaxID=1514080 RepID=A0A2S6I860_9BACT|nr:hypothetical protein [Neolewinella xylanilytica]PPK87680.1 hypothetical protein CLV84_0630 [Neolewinella xylanilytica]